MELTEHDRRFMASTRDRLLMEAMAAVELATTREEATNASYLEQFEKLRITRHRFARCRRQLRGCRRALWCAAFVAAVEAVVILVAAVLR